MVFPVPGDVTDIYSYVLKKLDHGGRRFDALRSGTYSASGGPQIVRDPIPISLTLYGATRWSTPRSSTWRSSTQAAAARSERIAHLICEQYIASEGGRLAELGKPVKFYITQTDIADATGLSLVHVNKTLKSLKAQNLIGRDPQMIEILDWEGLKNTAGFDLDLSALQEYGCVGLRRHGRAGFDRSLHLLAVEI